MTITNKAFWVFDLDDTLYKEIDYQESGLRFISSEIKKYYKKDISKEVEKATKKKLDVFEVICKELDLSSSFKNSLVWLYRNHLPDIKLESETEKFLKFINTYNNHHYAIITDGRSFSQRQKIFSLGLNVEDVLISEEWDSPKPNTMRFEYLMKKYKKFSQFIYVGDNNAKDFIKPNNLGWLTIGIKDNGKNIHKQRLDLDENFQPKFWVKSIKDIKNLLC